MRFRLSYGIAFGVLGLIILLSGLWFWRGAFEGQPRPLSEQPTARLTEVRGTVTVAHGDGQSVQVGSGAALVAGDVVSTGEESGAVIVSFWSSRTALDARTTLRIDEATAAAGAPARQNVRLTLVGGRVWSRILKLLDAQSSYQVEYNGVVSGVRGTAFLVTGQGTRAQIDVFDGTIGVSGKTTGAIAEGFSAQIDTARPPAFLDDVLVPTPDAVHNDAWVQEQLDDDAVFAGRVAEDRRSLGADAYAERNEVQADADSGVLADPGAPHSGYMRIDIVSPNRQLVVRPGQPVALQGFAVVETPNGETRRDVTTLATWQISHPGRASVSGGVVTVAGSAVSATSTITIDTQITLLINGKPVSTATTGQTATVMKPGVSSNEVLIVARWNDGTHEHSGAFKLQVER